ncbi:hypothetical protein JJB07_01565 [Tumebacillus sp. ITR2]|uniref:Uncharacterized protein n=1 Tax=Tumebacillus amylolyticus TaxID=2801339 RepID=A0ABS1J4W0_9BACL|nr:hypothetical protein [Tumebacillus amylolyticus]MBL0385321.1 hypothetical protein [Tumebacillus amylolyticus]
MPKKGKNTSKNTSKAQGTANNNQQTTPPSLGDQLKDRLKNVNKGGLLGMLGQVQKTTPDTWKDPEAVKEMAKKFAEQLKIPVNEDRLNQFMKAYKDATKGGNPNANVEDLVKKYGKGQVDDKTLKEMQKFIKPKD